MASLIQIAHIANSSYPALVNLPSPVSIGNTIIVTNAHSYAGCPVSAADTLSNTYTFMPASQLQAGSTSRYLEAFSAPITSAGNCGVTMSAACGTSNALYVSEWSGLAASPFDGATASEQFASPFSTTAITTTGNGDVVLGIFTCTGGTPTYTPTGTATEIGVGVASMIEFIIQPSAGAVQMTATGTGVDFSGIGSQNFAIALKTLPAVLRSYNAVSGNPNPSIISFNQQSQVRIT